MELHIRWTPLGPAVDGNYRVGNLMQNQLTLLNKIGAEKSPKVGVTFAARNETAERVSIAAFRARGPAPPGRLHCNNLVAKWICLARKPVHTCTVLYRF